MTLDPEFNVPSYDQLPVTATAPAGSSWGVWGPDDRLGTLNLLDDTRIEAGLAAVRTRQVFNLALPLGGIQPPLYQRRAAQHHVLDTAAGHDDYFDNWNPQSDSQWDGFRHVRHPGHGFYNGQADEQHGMHWWAERGIVGRGVLADVARWRAAEGVPIDCATSSRITIDEVAATLDTQGTAVETGDVLFIRTGWLEWYAASSPQVRAELAAAGSLQMPAPGLEPGRGTARYLWDLHIAALVMDNPAIEVWPRAHPLTRDEVAELIDDPERCEDAFLHFSLLPLLGIPLGELWSLGALAAACADDGRYEFLLASAPLNVVGGVSSPPNALAIR